MTIAKASISARSSNLLHAVCESKRVTFCIITYDKRRFSKLSINTPRHMIRDNEKSHCGACMHSQHISCIISFMQPVNLHSCFFLRIILSDHVVIFVFLPLFDNFSKKFLRLTSWSEKYHWVFQVIFFENFQQIFF